ncbi:MAG: WhiB family transcriptional regulator, partial [Arachnia sp.]
MSQVGRPTTRDEPTELTAWTALRLAISNSAVPCTQAEAEWFSDDPAEQRKAARHCGSCIAQKACAEYAITAGERHGV